MTRLLIPNTTQVPNVLLDVVMPQIGNPLLRVLLVLVRKTYGWGKQADAISVTQFIKLTGLSHGAVMKALKEARERHLVTADEGVRGRDTNVYRLNYDIKKAELVHKMDQSTKWTSPKNGPEVVHRMDTQKPNIQNQYTGPKAPVSSPSRRGIKLARRAECDPATLAAFDAFYQAYPRHVARQDALTAWAKLDPNPELQTSIMAAVARYAQENENTEQRYIPHPATWLNGRRWEDAKGGAGDGNRQTDGPPKILKHEGNMLTLADGSVMPKDSYKRRYGV